MKLLYRSIIIADWALAKLFWIPIELTWRLIDTWFTLVQWAEEELKDASVET